MAGRKTGGKTPKRQPQGDYEVGYGKPPRQHQFPPGTSGNPKRRPKGAKNFLTELEEVLNERIQVRINGKLTWMTRWRYICTAQSSKAGDDVRLFNSIIAASVRFGRLSPPHVEEEASELTESDEQIIADFLRRLSDQNGDPSE